MFSNIIAHCVGTEVFQLLKENKQMFKMSCGLNSSGWLPQQILVLVLGFGQMYTTAGC